MNINLYDAMNWIRVQQQNDLTGRYPRNLLNQMTISKDFNIWVWDGPNNKQSRSLLYPAYKAHRKPEGEDFWAFVEIIRKVLGHTHAKQILVPGVEADDVIATLARRYRGSCPVRIYSTDRDLAQLRGGGVHTSCEPETGIDPVRIRLYKTLVGDKSDNIPGARGFGRKSWDALRDEHLVEIERAVRGDDFDPDKTGLSDRYLDQLADLKIYWQIIGLADVEIAAIDRHTISGDGDYDAADAYLKRYLQ